MDPVLIFALSPVVWIFVTFCAACRVIPTL